MVIFHGYVTNDQLIHRIGWWENLQESPIFDGKNHGFRLRFSRENQSILSILAEKNISVASHFFQRRPISVQAIGNEVVKVHRGEPRKIHHFFKEYKIM